ncbi:MAG: hypothetical protein FWG94_01695 [Oscillospiraceae bacterium]|nr:hypothetical protein [Oscillospiraceae bacterium]
MSGLTVTARTLVRNSAVTFQNIKSLRIVSSLDSPADSLSAEIAANELHGDFGHLEAHDGAKLLFSGSIDSQQESVSGKGALIRLDARSAGALLLDNQALPSVLQNVQLGVLFNRCIAPYGFTLFNPNRAVYVPVFTIRAGQTEWDAFVDFSRRAHGITPHIKGTQVLIRRPGGGTRPVIISNSADGASYSSITHTRTPYSIISRVILRDENGQYTLAVRNSAASYTGAVRKRYMVPMEEHADRMALDANQRIRRSMLEYEHVAVTLPGFVDIGLGDDIAIRDEKIQLNNLSVGEREFFADEHGMITKIKAVNPLYYD